MRIDEVTDNKANEKIHLHLLAQYYTVITFVGHARRTSGFEGLLTPAHITDVV